MSTRRITVGLLIGMCLLAGGLAAIWFLDLPAHFLPIALAVMAMALGGILSHLHRSRSLRPYWNRVCMGLRWRRHFPDSTKAEIREFLSIFVEAFIFPQVKRSRFSPDDRILDIYRALYPADDYLADSCELEVLAQKLEGRYGIDLQAIWREGMTLGDLYEQTRTGAA